MSKAIVGGKTKTTFYGIDIAPDGTAVYTKLLESDSGVVRPVNGDKQSGELFDALVAYSNGEFFNALEAYLQSLRPTTCWPFKTRKN